VQVATGRLPEANGAERLRKATRQIMDLGGIR